ncbi:MAG: 5-(carboxyamino)imidazole ribonucleotide synthase [Chloroflexi bacterium]|nr:5-(carboxyamino)imidazole ribonucleotide synthase [Chloroflexota bacterium]
MSAPILPGATIGILGSGQLGRMLALVARRMGYRVATYSPDRDSPTGQVADREVVADYDDLDAVRAFARHVEVVTFEFENVPSTTVEAIAAHAPVRPSAAVLHMAQHRLREKTFLARHGFPVAPFAPVREPADLTPALAAVGLPAVLKTAGFGYDGKGQFRVHTPAEAPLALATLRDTLGTGEAILEAFVDFAAELSVIVARAATGATVLYGPVENRHERHILDTTRAPATVRPTVAAAARELATDIARALDVVGVLCVELFLTRDERLVVNELAPRPHNSGHYTIEACLTSQFEQQLRTACGLPLGDPTQLRPAAMANLLGDLWQEGEPNWAAALAVPEVKLHLYGKTEARPGRKMGHLTALADTVEEAATRVLGARAALTVRHGRPG